MTEIQALREQLLQLERRIRPLEWDAGRNQINDFKKKELQRLQQERGQLLLELRGLEEKKEGTEVPGTAESL